MCGIAGIYFFNKESRIEQPVINNVLSALKHRGPDNQNHFQVGNCCLFHARLSILDLSDASNQPFTNNDKTKAMAYNGEIFNYAPLSKDISPLNTSGDAEVLFKLFDKNGISCLNSLNGFFSFAFYNSEANEFSIVRDRYGVKPLYYYADNEKIAFASELKPLLYLTGAQEINTNALHCYFRLNYISGKETIFRNIYRLLPGEYISVKNKKLHSEKWYEVPELPVKSDLFEVLSDSVKLRLHADVPVGSFLSGGLDSSIISALATKHHKNIHTFSIGFADEPYFDETHYAELTAKHIGSNHHVFKLKNSDFLNAVQPFFESIDEPFADSSALNVYILSQYTKKHVKVALSGDGADELFMGYNKHKAEYLSKKFLYKNILPAFEPIFGLLQGSRNSSFSNKIRQLKRFSGAVKLSDAERYISWASISSGSEVNELLKDTDGKNFNQLFGEFFAQKKFNPVNLADLGIVLADDMLVKADRMSMRHGLELRNPFIDYRVVETALNLPLNQKINSNHQKVILRNTFSHLLPPEILNRSKKGFELPLWKWLKNELSNEINGNLLSDEFINEQGIFNYKRISQLKVELFSSNPGDAPAKIWALLIFQHWYMNYTSHNLIKFTASK